MASEQSDRGMAMLIYVLFLVSSSGFPSLIFATFSKREGEEKWQKNKNKSPKILLAIPMQIKYQKLILLWLFPVRLLFLVAPFYYSTHWLFCISALRLMRTDKLSLRIQRVMHCFKSEVCQTLVIPWPYHFILDKAGLLRRVYVPQHIWKLFLTEQILWGNTSKLCLSLQLLP